ncbi:MAG: DivIVA domain-containing protein [Deltaproteobacteria bacterium]|nr:DivIVA domain-containing protein [Deltaproteobacteria bacterium]
MKLTPLEIRSHGLRKSFKGYDVKGVEELRDMAADALEEAAREIMALEERISDLSERNRDYAANENILRETITTAQRMVDDLKANARKEAELVVAEARLNAEDIIRQAQERASRVQDDIYRLRKQRKELEASMKAVLDYHSGVFLAEEEEARRADEETDKLKYLSK